MTDDGRVVRAGSALGQALDSVPATISFRIMHCSKMVWCLRNIINLKKRYGLSGAAKGNSWLSTYSQGKIANLTILKILFRV